MTTSKLQLAIEAVVDLVTAVGGINHAPDYPPESPNVFPFLVCYAGGGDYSYNSPGEMVGMHNIIVELHINRKELPLDVEKLMAFSNSIPEAIMSSYTLNGTCDTLGSVGYRISDVKWANIDTIALIFEIRNVKIREDFA